MSKRWIRAHHFSKQGSFLVHFLCYLTAEMHQMFRPCDWRLPWNLPFPHKQMMVNWSKGTSLSSVSLGQPYAAKRGSLAEQQLLVFAATGQTLSPFCEISDTSEPTKSPKVPAISGNEPECSACNYCQLLPKAL